MKIWPKEHGTFVLEPRFSTGQAVAFSPQQCFLGAALAAAAAAAVYLWLNYQKNNSSQEIQKNKGGYEDLMKDLEKNGSGQNQAPVTPSQQSGPRPAGSCGVA